MNEPEIHEEFLCFSAEDEGVRLDKFLASRFPSHSRTYFQYLIGEGFVLINGAPVKKRTIPEEGDEIEVLFQATPEASLLPENIPLDILYEDEHLLAINKPFGMVVHPAPGHWSGTVVNALLAHCEGQVPGNDPLRPGIVHRLDKDTTGVLLAAKTETAHKRLIELFANRSIQKLYLAICHGTTTNRQINLPIGRHPVHRKEMAVLSDGRDAVTEVQLAATDGKYSFLIVKPKTGRTHQIRVHLKHIGCPIVGDPIYGKKEEDRCLLHAYQLTFQHPVTGCPLKIVAPIPPDIKIWLKKLAAKTDSRITSGIY